ncbi:F-box-like protein [Ceratobasidium sp. AG-Ba]|nr:F-box-like protein [Ceratobasidium sp. AG-Ba]
MLCDLPVELLSLILSFLDILSLKNTTETCRLLRAVSSDDVLNPWHHPARLAIGRLFATDQGQEEIQEEIYSKQETPEYPLNLASTPYESQELALLSALGEYSTVPRSTLVDVLVLAPPRFLLYCSGHSNLPRRLWEDAFRRRFLPSWVHVLERQKWSWREGFFRTLEQVHHRLTSNCTSTESWINYVVILRSGIAATCTAYARTFSALVIMNDLKRQANLLDYETQARVILRLADIRVVMLGVLRKPPYFAINKHARELLHPQGVEKWDEETRPSVKELTTSGLSRPQTSFSLPSPAAPVSLAESTISPPDTRRHFPLRTSRTRSPSLERRRDTSNNLRLSRTLTHESAVSTAESTSSASRGLFNRLRRWTSGPNDRSQPEPGPSTLPSTTNNRNESAGPPSPSWTTSAHTPNTSMPHNSTPNPATSPDVSTRRPRSNTLPVLQHPEPSGGHALYPNYTPGGTDSRWHVEDGIEEGGLVWVGPVLILAQLIPHGTANASTVQNVGDVFSQGHHVSFRWDDLIAIAPWMEDRLIRRDNGLTES